LACNQSVTSAMWHLAVFHLGGIIIGCGCGVSGEAGGSWPSAAISPAR
jgi:hypothetical protein